MPPVTVKSPSFDKANKTDKSPSFDKTNKVAEAFMFGSG